MKIHALLLALIPVPPVPSASEAPFNVDVQRVVALAVAAVEQRYPEISADELVVESSIDFHCWSNRPDERSPALDSEFQPCFAKVELALASAKEELSYVDRDGICRVAEDSRVFIIGLQPGSSINAGLKGRSDTDGRAVDCAVVFGKDIPAPTSESLVDSAYAFEVKKIVEIAFKTAIEKYPDISPDDLELGRPMIEVSCRPDFSEGRISARNAKFAPCTAEVVFSSPSSIIEMKYVDADGSCNIWRGPEDIRVRIGGGQIDPDCARGSFGVTEQLVVECTEEFDDAERW